MLGSRCGDFGDGTWRPSWYFFIAVPDQYTQNTAPTPAPAPTQISLTGRWIGLAPDGMIISDPASCDSEQDLTFDFTQTGSSLSGTVTDRPRKFNPSACNAPTTGKTGSVSGTVGAGVFSFTGQGERGTTVTFEGTFTATRMIGRLVGGGGGDVTFAVNRQ